MQPTTHYEQSIQRPVRIRSQECQDLLDQWASLSHSKSNSFIDHIVMIIALGVAGHHGDNPLIPLLARKLRDCATPPNGTRYHRELDVKLLYIHGYLPSSGIALRDVMKEAIIALAPLIRTEMRIQAGGTGL